MSYLWQFGNGADAVGRVVQHQFHAAGNYTVKLRVTDSWGNWGFYTRAVPVR